MHLQKIVIENCKSFATREEVPFRPDLNVFIGPNGGGKSNLFDIFTVVLRKWFLYAYRERIHSDRTGAFKALEYMQTYGEMAPHLPKHYQHGTKSQVISLSLAVDELDARNIDAIAQNRERFEKFLRDTFRSAPYNNLSFLDSYKSNILGRGTVLTYTVTDHSMPDHPQGSAEWLLLHYLRHIEMFALLESGLGSTRTLVPPLVMFPAFRMADPSHLEANLSGTDIFDIRMGQAQATTKTSATAIHLSSLSLASTRRALEHDSRSQGFADEWAKVEEVKRITEALRDVGFDWDLNAIDKHKNIYQIVVRKNAQEIRLADSSSGEKELFNFAFGLCALGGKGGTAVIDEPELHLHPKWQRSLLKLFRQFVAEEQVQFFLATHSGVFVDQESLPNLIRLYRDRTESTRCVTFVEKDLPEAREALHLVSAFNNERIFFADLIILVEGLKDWLVFDRLFARASSQLSIKMDVEVVYVGGKNNFDVYLRLLKALHVEARVIADVDYLLEAGGAECRQLFEISDAAIDKNVLKNKKSGDRETLHSVLRTAIESKDFDALIAFCSYIERRHTRLKQSLSPSERKVLQDVTERLATGGVYVLPGEIEDLLPPDHRSIEGLLKLVRDEDFERWIGSIEHDSGLRTLLSVVDAILKPAVKSSKSG